MKKKIIITVTALIFLIGLAQVAIYNFAHLIPFSFGSREQTSEHKPMVSSLGSKEYFEIPEESIIKYTLSNDEGLLWNEADPRNSNSVTDRFRLTATTVKWLNPDFFESGKPFISPLTVNMLNGPFFLKIDETQNLLELKIDDYVCYQIKYSPAGGRLLSSILKERGCGQAILKDNMLDHSVVNNVNDAILFPLIFMQDYLEVNDEPLVSIIPQQIIEETLFHEAKTAQCILEVNNDDYALLVCVLRGYNSYIH